jgi:hypothetical protein
MRSMTWVVSAAFAAALAISAGCQQETAPAKAASPAAPNTAKPAAPEAAKPVANASAAAKAAAAPVAAIKAIRINCGASAPVTDKSGNTWLADTGFADGDVIERSQINAEGTPTPEIYRTERYGMTRFSQVVPNGKYTVKLHFCETYEGISAAGERVFAVDVEGTPIKGIDPFKDGGGASKPTIRTADVEVKDGKLDIGFIADVQSPEINGIEIIAR